MASAPAQPHLVLRVKAVWRFLLTGVVVFGIGGAVGQQQWGTIPSVLAFAPLAAYAWWARVEVTSSTITVRRLRTSTARLEGLTEAARVFTGGRVPYRALQLRTRDGTVRLWLVWWDRWRDLAARLEDRGFDVYGRDDE